MDQDIRLTELRVILRFPVVTGGSPCVSRIGGRSFFVQNSLSLLARCSGPLVSLLEEEKCTEVMRYEANGSRLGQPQKLWSNESL